MIMVFVQVLINIGMNVGLLPVTGLPAPFLSYGGSSLLSLMASLGLLLAVYQRKRGADDMRISLEKSLLEERR